MAADAMLDASPTGAALANCFESAPANTTVDTAKPRRWKNVRSFSNARFTRFFAPSSLMPNFTPVSRKLLSPMNRSSTALRSESLS